MTKYIWILALLLVGCNRYNNNSTYVKIKTNYGDIVVRLYNQTPIHTNNYVKLADEKFFDGTIFHRVIKDFMIQGGDPDTKNAIQGKVYGENDAGYLLEPEFIDTIIHKRGAIAMAREGDEVNPEKKSSSSQFYIVVGKVYTPDELDALEDKMNKRAIESLRNRYFEELFADEKNIDSQEVLIKINSIVKQKIDSAVTNTPKFKLSQRQRKIYTTTGGTPHLDGNYTVFGEVVEGMDVVEKISLAKTDDNDRPLTDIKMKVRVLN